MWVKFLEDSEFLEQRWRLNLQELRRGQQYRGSYCICSITRLYSYRSMNHQEANFDLFQFSLHNGTHHGTYYLSIPYVVICTDQSQRIAMASNETTLEVVGRKLNLSKLS
jgi:hypothetical protein